MPLFFYSNPHHAIHVHVRHGGGEPVFDVETKVELLESQSRKVKEFAGAAHPYRVRIGNYKVIYDVEDASS